MKPFILSGILLLLIIPCIAQNQFLDQSFNGTGSLSSNIMNRVEAIAQQPDGKLLLAGSTEQLTFINSDTVLTGFTLWYACVVRLNTDGSFDTTFGINGLSALFMPAIGGSSIAKDIDIQPGGKIVIVTSDGCQADCNGKLIRLNIDGTLDTTFGAAQTGIVNIEYPPSSTFEGSGAVRVTKNNKILTGGSSGAALAVKRFTTDGIPDSTFGINSLANHPHANSVIKDILELPDSSILAIESENVKLYKLTKNGQTFTAFGDSGEVNFTQDWNNSSYSIAIDNENNVYISGRKYMKMAIYTCSETGGLNTNFTDTLIFSPQSPEGVITGLYFTPQGRPVVAAELYSNPTNFSLIGLNPDFSINTSFGNAGIASDTDTMTFFAYASLKQVDNKIVIAGGGNLNYGMHVVRFNADMLSSIDEEPINTITLYPNPTQNLLNISIGKMDNNGVNIQLLNTLGQVVKTQAFSNSSNLQMDISTIPNGIYFVQVQAFGGMKTLRLIKN